MDITQLNQLTKHVYWLAPDERTDRPTLGVIVGSKATLIVDAGNSPAHAQILLNAMDTLKLAKPTYVVLTHWHWDHVFGAVVFEGSDVDATIFAHQETQRYVEEMVQQDWSDEALDKRVADGTEIEFCRDMIKVELPDRTGLQIRPAHITFATELTFDLGDISCQVKHVGGDHSSDSCVIFVPEDGVLFLSDCLYPDLHHGPYSYTHNKLLPLLNVIEHYRADFYLLGHDEEPMPKAEMETFIQMLRTIGNLVQKLGKDRSQILEELPALLNEPLSDDHVETVDTFLAGI